MEKLLQQWKERKQNNKGSALAMVITVMAIVGVLAVTLMLTSLLTFKMKLVYTNSQKNFYSAESVMDDIHVGLQKILSDSAGSAYAWTLENYSGTNANAREAVYLDKFEDYLIAALEDSSASDQYSKKYSISLLESMVSDDVKSAAKSVGVSSSVAGANALNLDSDKATYTLKNVQVKYVNQKDYVSIIKTDIVLSCPKIEFNQKVTSALDLTGYSLIANENTQTSGGSIQILGNAYLGKDGADFNNTKITFDAVTGSSCRMITSSGLNVTNGSTLTVSATCDTWAKDLYVDNSDALVSGSTYLSDDIVLQSGANVSASGELYAYGNTTTAGILEDQTSTDVADSPADYSSSILINGKDTTLNLSGLNKLWISGTSYVNASAKNSSINSTNTPTGGNNKDVQMGESISLKSNQRAYMVPAEYVAPGYTHGSKNPMLGTDFEALKTEIFNAQKDAMGYSQVSDINQLEYLRNKKSTNLGVPGKLSQYGVTGVQTVVYPISSNGTTINMVYFFLVFDSESSANSFAKNYYDENTDEGKNLSTLNNAISTSHYNASILTPSNITSQSLDKFTFYYNGCILVPDSAASSDVKVYTGKLSSLSSSDETSLRKQERTYQETFAALRHKLITDYDKLTGTNEKTNDVYENLVGDSVRNTYVSEPEKKITVGEKKVFVTDVTNTAIDQMCAVVVNGDYTIDRKSTDPGNEAYEYGDPTMGSGDRFPVHVVIAEGDVTVKCNFNGLIIAKGKVTIAAKNLTISADADLSQQALRIQNADGVSASDYLLDGGAYLLNSTSSSSTGDVSISDYIAYNNWVKQ